MEKEKIEYNDYTLGLALFDAVPVFIFLLSGLVIYAISGSALALAGAVVAFGGGLSKVIWKIRIVRRGTDSACLTKAFHILLPLGLALMAAAAVVAAAKGKGGDLARSVTMMPAALFFVAALAGACLMGWLGSRLDSSARANWIEELLNTAWQASLLIGVTILYFTLCYQAGDAAQAALKGSNEVTVTETKEAYFFDGSGSDIALIFYPGARVEAAAYAPLMEKIAEAGTDCYLCKMPGNFAIFGKNMAADIRASSGSQAGSADTDNPANHNCTGSSGDASLSNNVGSADSSAETDNPANHNRTGSSDDAALSNNAGSADNSADTGSYRRWYIGGHSLGGAVAAMLAENESWDGLVLLAAYPTGAIDEPVLTLYGSEDRVLNMNRYTDAGEEEFWPDDTTEIVIKGGNHAGFGDYGNQKGDGAAAIPPSEQQQITADAISRFTSKYCTEPEKAE